MSESQEQRIRRVAKENPELGSVTCYASDIVELLDALLARAEAAEAQLAAMENARVGIVAPDVPHAFSLMADEIESLREQLAAARESRKRLVELVRYFEFGYLHWICEFDELANQYQDARAQLAAMAAERDAARAELASLSSWTRWHG